MPEKCWPCTVLWLCLSFLPFTLQPSHSASSAVFLQENRCILPQGVFQHFLHIVCLCYIEIPPSLLVCLPERGCAASPALGEALWWVPYRAKPHQCNQLRVGFAVETPSGFLPCISGLLSFTATSSRAEGRGKIPLVSPFLGMLPVQPLKERVCTKVREPIDELWLFPFRSFLFRLPESAGVSPPALT